MSLKRICSWLENWRRPAPVPTARDLGIYQPGGGIAIDAYIQQAGKVPAFAWSPMTWQTMDGVYREFDTKILDQYRTRGILPGLTWSPSKGAIEEYPNREDAINQPVFSWKQIADGVHDDYLKWFARGAVAYGYSFLLRFMHEPDGTWYPWAYNVNGNTTPADYLTAWRHIISIFRIVGAKNVQFVWCLSALSSALIQKYDSILRQIYPGDDVVDWLGLDGYSNQENNYRSLVDEFLPLYNFIVGLSACPVILFEVGAVEKTGSPNFKANWLTQGFLTDIPQKMTRVQTATYFNSRDGSGRDYRLTSSTAATNAWKKVVASPLYRK